MTDQFYVSRAQAGDHAAYTALVAAYRQMVYGVCYRVTGNADDADDLAHVPSASPWLVWGVGLVCAIALFGYWRHLTRRARALSARPAAKTQAA